MNKKIVQIMILAIVLFAGFILDANAQCGCDTNLPTVISGTVKNSSNVPMQNVKVTIVDTLTSDSLFAFTDSSGNYSVNSSGTYEPFNNTISSCKAYRILIDKEGVSPTETIVSTNKTSSSCPDPTATNFTYDRSCNENSPTIWGYVLDPEGFPLEGVAVNAWHNYGETQANPKTRYTDANGYYAFQRHHLEIYTGWLTWEEGSCREWVVKAVGTQSPPLVLNPLTNDTYDTYEGVNFRVFP